METWKSSLGLMIQEKEASLVVEPACRAEPLHCLHMLHYSADDLALAEALSGRMGARSP